MWLLSRTHFLLFLLAFPQASLAKRHDRTDDMDTPPLVMCSDVAPLFDLMNCVTVCSACTRHRAPSFRLYYKVLTTAVLQTSVWLLDIQLVHSVLVGVLKPHFCVELTVQGYTRRSRKSLDSVAMRKTFNATMVNLLLRGKMAQSPVWPLHPRCRHGRRSE
jgi:hypothetical protein